MQAIRRVGSMSSKRCASWYARWLSIFIFLASFSMIHYVLYSPHDDSTTSDEVAAAEVPVAVIVATPTPDDVSLDEATTAETSTPLDPVTIVSWLPTAWTTPGYEALGNNRQRYAEMHGYNFLKFNESNLPTHELTRDWASMKHRLKPNLLLHLVQHTPGWIIWMDADTLFTNFTTRWSELLRGDVVFAEAPDVVTNNGVFALRAGEVAKHFVLEWLRQIELLLQDKIPGFSGDNFGFILSLLVFVSGHDECRSTRPDYTALRHCYHRSMNKLSPNNEKLRSTGPRNMYGASWVEDPHFTGLWGINSGLGFIEPNNWQPGHFILHFAGQDAKTREANALRFTNTSTY